MLSELIESFTYAASRTFYIPCNFGNQLLSFYWVAKYSQPKTELSAISSILQGNPRHRLDTIYQKKKKTVIPSRT